MTFATVARRWIEVDVRLSLRKSREVCSSLNESDVELVLFTECDRLGRNSGIETSELEVARQYIRDLANIA